MSNLLCYLRNPFAISLTTWFYLPDFPSFGLPDLTRIFAAMKPAEINTRWKELQERIAADFDSDTPDMKVMLFLIGVQELGKGPQKFNKRQKEELMHIATCKLFSLMGFYELEGLDQDGWPHWNLVKPIPNYTLLEQEMTMKSLVINYFDEMDQ
jgi:hypothetical protein